MSKVTHLIQSLRQKLSGAAPPAQVLSPQIDGYLLGQLIGRAIREKNPLLVSRLGWTEATCLGIYLDQGKKSDEALRQRIWKFSGVFPPTENQFSDFAREYLGAIGSADVFGLLSSPHEKILVDSRAPSAILTALGSLEPYFSADPWSQWLEGKRVLVVHPFVESIERQFRESRTQLFVNPKVLPPFELQVVRAPQGIAGNTCEFASWNEALEHLKGEARRREYDIAILGCGAYGLPLGAYIKSLGKVCVHLGGSTQLLFGITGTRWRNQPAFRALETGAWCTPLESERPAGWQGIESGCYW